MIVVVCQCTCPDAVTAPRIADAVVAERLAACAQVGASLHSTWRRDGAIESADEVPLAMKTTPARWPALQQRVLALHPYELPELPAVEAIATPAYAARVAAETTDPGPR